MDWEKPAVIAQNLTRDFGDFRAVDGINFEVRRGEIFGFLGPNGSGKTTTIRMLLGLVKPSAGYVDMLGVRVTDLPRQIRRRVGYMSQRFSLYNDLTVIQNLEFYGKAYGLKGRNFSARVQTVLRQAGLEGRGDVLTKTLAGGWRQRLALGAAILHQPEIIFLDEPTAGVDPVSRRAFWDLLYRLVVEGITVFVTTHYMDEAEHCHRLAFIQRGQLIATGSPQTIKADLMPAQVLEVTPSDPAAAIRALEAARLAGRLQFSDLELYGPRVHLLGPNIVSDLQAIAMELTGAGVDPGHMEMIEPSLEDVFIACMRE